MDLSLVCIKHLKIHSRIAFFTKQSYQTRKKILNKLINHHNQKKTGSTIEQTKKHFLNFLFGENSRWINIFHNLFCDSMIMMMMMVVVVFKILDFCFWSKTKSWTLESVFGLHFSFYFFVYLSNSFNIQFKRKKQNWKQESFLGIIFSEIIFFFLKKILYFLVCRTELKFFFCFLDSFLVIQCWWWLFRLLFGFFSATNQTIFHWTKSNLTFFFSFTLIYPLGYF